MYHVARGFDGRVVVDSNITLAAAKRLAAIYARTHSAMFVVLDDAGMVVASYPPSK
jgi:hypothetical protein